MPELRNQIQERGKEMVKNIGKLRNTNYLHHSANPEAAVDGVDADYSLGGMFDDSIEKPKMVCQH